MATVEELIVAAKPQGLEETTDGFEEMEEDLGEVSEEMGNMSESLEDTQSKWQGAMGAIVGGLAVATGGLLSQVPILGELFSGLGAIVSALALKLDTLLRPTLGPLTEDFFGVANAIDEANVPVNKFTSLVTTLAVGMVGLAAGIGAVGGAIPSLSAVGSITTVFGTLAGFVSSLASGFAGLVAGSTAAAAAFGALIGVLTVGVLEVTGFMDAVRDLGTMVGQDLPGWARDGFLAFVSITAGALAVVGAAIAGFVQGTLQGGLSQGIDQAIADATSVLDSFILAWENTFARISKFVTSLVSDAAQWGADIATAITESFVQEIRGFTDVLEDVSQGDFTGAANAILDLGGGGAGGGGSTRSFGASRNRTQQVNIDGRRVDAQTGRYRKDASTRRGI